MFVLATALLLSSGLGGCELGSLDARARVPATQPDIAPNATIRRVIDGDTVDVDLNGSRERVRMLGINTPETKKPNAPIECFGPQASEYTTSLLPPGTPVHLERDIVGRDDYGRILAYVYRSSDGLFVNLDLVRRGYAKPMPFHPNDAHRADFAGAAEMARNDAAGWWGACAG